MSNRVGKVQKQKAKAVNLIDYMRYNHPNAIKLETKTARLRKHPSIILVADGFFENPSKVHHDTIEFLMKFQEMTFQDAVRELSEYYDKTASADPYKGSAAILRNLKTEQKHFELPPVSEEETDKEQMFQYLRKKGIEMIPELQKYIYPTRRNDYVNIVFQSSVCDYAEIHGTLDPIVTAKPFKSKAKGSDCDGYFIIGDVDGCDTIYICETAIEAISLMLYYGGGEPMCAYASIGNVGNSAAVRRITRVYPYARIIIAFNNDEVGRLAANKYPYEAQYPTMNNWNEELMNSMHKD